MLLSIELSSSNVSAEEATRVEVNRADQNQPIEDLVTGTEITPPVRSIHRVYRAGLPFRRLVLPTLAKARTTPDREIEVRVRWERDAKFEVAIHPNDIVGSDQKREEGAVFSLATMGGAVFSLATMGVVEVRRWGTHLEPDHDTYHHEGLAIFRPGLSTWWVEVWGAVSVFRRDGARTLDDYRPDVRGGCVHGPDCMMPACPGDGT